jgi:hypothetical protein
MDRFAPVRTECKFLFSRDPKHLTVERPSDRTSNEDFFIAADGRYGSLNQGLLLCFRAGEPFSALQQQWMEIGVAFLRHGVLSC